MSAVYLGNFGVALGACRQSVEDAALRGQLLSPAAALRAAGFDRHYVCSDDETAYDLAARALRASNLDLHDIDMILYSTCLPRNAHDGDDEPWRQSRDVKDLMRFPASRLQAEFGLGQAAIVGINQQACTGMLGALRIGRALLLAEPRLRAVLCITADRFPAGARYEQAYNLVSDGAAACRLDRNAGSFRILAVHHLANGGMLGASDDETAGSYFNYCCRLLDETLAAAGLGIADIRYVVPQNINHTAWTVLARLLGLSTGQCCPLSVADTGHVISADNIINLDALLKAGRLTRGDRVLTFMAGFGSHWQCALLEAA